MLTKTKFLEAMTDYIAENALVSCKDAEYFAEQASLIMMVTDIKLIDLFTIQINTNTEGFEAQEGEDVESDEEARPPVQKKAPKL